MRVSILGAGRWGSTLAWVQSKEGREVVLWNIEDDFLKEWQKKRKNKYLSLPKSVNITSDINEALKSEVIFIAIKVQYFRELCQKLVEASPQNKLFILAMKGIEGETGKRLSEIFAEYLGLENKLGILAGPGHSQELSKNIPTVMVCATCDINDLEKAVAYCQTGLIKIFPSKDFLGVEIGSALKNIMGLAGGMLSALGMPSFKSYILARGPVEVGNLIKAMGGQYQTAFGLSHLGDYGATVFSSFSYNHQAGEMWVKEKKLSDKAEGIPTLKAVKLLSEKYQVKMPICQAVYQVLYEGMEPKDLVKVLMEREGEFESS